MKEKIFLLTFLILFCSSVIAQTYTYYGSKVFGSDQDDYAPMLLNRGSGTLVLAGTSNGNFSGNKTEAQCDSTIFNTSDIWLVKIDTAFNILWDKSYGGNSKENHPSLIETKNSNRLILTCTSGSDSSCEKTTRCKDCQGFLITEDYWIAVMDTNGNNITDHTWGGNNSDVNSKTIELSSGNFITCGGSSSPISDDKTVMNCTDSLGNVSADYWIIKTDSLGNKLWDKTYGGIGKEGNANGLYRDLFSILPDKNEGFILAGTTDSPIGCTISDSSRGDKDYWILNIDSNGNKLWDKRYGGSASDECNHIIHSNDNGYMVCGTAFSPQGGDVSDSSKGGADCWVLKLDSMGNKLWDKRYGGNKGDVATWIEKAPGGGYWVSGQTASDISGDVTEPKYSLQLSDYWIFKIDESGNKLWDKRFGGPGNNTGSTFTIMPDGSIFLIGSSGPGLNSLKTDSGWGKLDYWIVHFKYTDSLSTSGINTLSNFSNNITVFPNPAKDMVTITSAKENIKSVALINLLGETLFEQKVSNTNNTQLNLQVYPQGFYFVKINGANYTVTKKVLRQ